MESRGVKINEAEPAIRKQMVRDAAGQTQFLSQCHCKSSAVGMQKVTNWNTSLQADFLTFPGASFPVRTVSLTHMVGIHCKEFSRKGAVLVHFVSNCHTQSEILILQEPRH